MTDLIATREAARRELAKRSLYHFVKQAWAVIEPSLPMVDNWHIKLICDKIQNHVQRKSKKKNLYLAVPPGSMKSTVLSVMLVPWMWTHKPAYRAGYFAGAEPLSIRDSLKCKHVLTSDWYKNTFNPTWEFSKNQDEKGLFANTATGFRYCAPAGAGVTGLRFDDIFIDDPMDAQKVYSDAYRYHINEEWWPAVYNRLNDMQEGRRTLIMQRLHEDDFAGHVVNESWDTCILRSVKEDGDNEPGDDRKVGELLFPARFPQSSLDEDRVILRHMYEAQHQQRPQPLGGGMLKPSLMRKVEIGDGRVLADGVSYKISELVRFCTVDMAASLKTQADQTVITIGMRLPDGRPVLDEVQGGRWEVPESRERLLSLWRSGRIQYIAVETANVGIGVIQDLKIAGCTVKELKAAKDKVTRAMPLKIALDSGRVLVNSICPWYSEMAHDMAQFPMGKHDDYTDSLAWFAHECQEMPIYCGNSFNDDGEQGILQPETWAERMDRSFGD